MDMCSRHARSCLHEYRLDAADGDEHDFVNEAFADIVEGRIQWNPARRSLLDQMCDVIRYRVRNQKHSAARRAQVPMGACDEDLHAEMTAAVGEPDDPAAQLRRKQERELGARIAAELAMLVGQGDGDAAAILACWTTGTLERKDILAETGMSADAYHDARRRLVRLGGRIAEELGTKKQLK